MFIDIDLQILTQCNCTPSFHALGLKERPALCLGFGLTCMNRIIRAIGKYNTVGDERKLCLAACQDQVNAVSVTSSNFPNRETFVEREEFCLLVEKLIRTCKSVGKYYVLSKFYPNLCLLLWEIRNVTDSKGKRPMCDQMKWTPRDMGFDEKDPRQDFQNY